MPGHILPQREAAGNDYGEAELNLPGTFDGSNYSRISFDVTNPHADDAYVRANIMIYSAGAQAGWGYAGNDGYIPSGVTRTLSCDLNVVAGNYHGLPPMVDVSALVAMPVSAV